MGEVVQIIAPTSSNDPSKRPTTMTHCHRLLSALAFLLVIGLGTAPASHAQFTSIDGCTSLEQLPLTEGIRSTLTEEWSGSAFETVSRAIYNRDAGDQLTELIIQRRDSGAWGNLFRTLPTFNNELLTTCTLQVWDGAWVNATRISRTYDENDRVDVSVAESWDEDAGTWQNGSRNQFTYDTDGNLTQQLDQSWDGSNWQNSGRTTNTYNSGNLTRQLNEIWAGSWLNSRRTTNTYDGENRVTETLTETWDLFISDWANALLTTFTYDGTPTTITQIDQQWDGGAWVDLARTTTDLNDEDLPTVAIADSSSGPNWIRKTRNESSYIPIDGQTKLLTLLEQTCASDCSVAKIAWENASRITFSYSEVLPVELARFTVTASGRDALLRWATASETNNAGFEVQRRLAADLSFEPIGFVEGTGTTTAPQRYRFTDAGLPFEAATATYRLKQVDFDGAFAYSPLVELQLGRVEQFALHSAFPNPAHAQATLRYELPTDGPVHLGVYNLLGQRIRTLVAAPQAAGRHEMAFGVSGLASGVYFIRLQMAGRTLTRQLTVVQ